MEQPAAAAQSGAVTGKPQCRRQMMVAARTEVVGLAEGQRAVEPGSPSGTSIQLTARNNIPLSNNVVPLEQHYTPSEVAVSWALSENTIRSLFANEPGVLIIDRPERCHKRRYRSMRIPESAIRRVADKLGRRRAS